MRRAPLPLAVVTAAVLLAACSGGQPGGQDVPPSPVDQGTPGSEPSAPPASTTGAPAVDDVRLTTEVIADGLNSPVFVTHLRGTQDLLVLEQAGRIVRVSEAGETTTWLDLRDEVGSGGNEQGLLGLTLHPAFPDDDRVWVHYTDRDGATTLDVLRADVDAADPASRVNLLTVPQPASNHNGGMLAFGPDGMLYLALGDGGGGGDQFGNAQDRQTILGAILRLDVDAHGDGYVAAADNPFADGEEGDDRVWVYGLRNPWRFSFDGDRIFIGDVGQGSFEEISTLRVPDDGGANLGWPFTEGQACFRPTSGCDRTGLTLPVITYPTHEGGTCSVVQGPAYRGTRLPALEGHVFYADFCAGFLRSFLPADDGKPTVQRDWTAQVGAIAGTTSLGLDRSGELLVLARDGRVLRVVPVV